MACEGVFSRKHCFFKGDDGNGIGISCFSAASLLLRIFLYACVWSCCAFGTIAGSAAVRVRPKRLTIMMAKCILSVGEVLILE